ncbi:unnamed protein product [Rangifer tarandus platyrhynchus]|uniref:Uncharacterized protein n=1 Tax=Rangifer tarandus platyrhynchus TaxID=3082113 RepID=A0ABN8XSV2_RANTA|nr:unnamed protein product [Rangifer tarandus platyrhynchus]
MRCLVARRHAHAYVRVPFRITCWGTQEGNRASPGAPLESAAGGFVYGWVRGLVGRARAGASIWERGRGGAWGSRRRGGAMRLEPETGESEKERE